MKAHCYLCRKVCKTLGQQLTSYLYRYIIPCLATQFFSYFKVSLMFLLISRLSTFLFDFRSLMFSFFFNSYLRSFFTLFFHIFKTGFLHLVCVFASITQLCGIFYLTIFEVETFSVSQDRNLSIYLELSAYRPLILEWRSTSVLCHIFKWKTGYLWYETHSSLGITLAIEAQV